MFKKAYTLKKAAVVAAERLVTNSLPQDYNNLNDLLSTIPPASPGYNPFTLSYEYV